MDSFAALADPTRRHLVATLASGERSFGELAALFEISRPAVSQHLKVLKGAGLVHSRPDGQRRLYALNEAALDEVEGWVAEVRGFWCRSLASLEAALGEQGE